MVATPQKRKKQTPPILEKKHEFGEFINLLNGLKALPWGPTESKPYLNIYPGAQTHRIRKLITVGCSGIVHAYDIQTGKLLWTYEARDQLNEILWGNNWPVMGFVTEEKPSCIPLNILWLTPSHKEHNTTAST